MWQTLGPTLALEIPIAVLWLWAKRKTATPGSLSSHLSVLTTCLLCNILTQAGLWLALLTFYNHYWSTLLLAEAALWTFEAFCYTTIASNQMSWQDACLLSLLCNGTSFSLGLFLP